MTGAGPEAEGGYAMAVLIASVVLLYVLFCALAILVIVLYRQFGLVYMEDYLKVPN